MPLDHALGSIGTQTPQRSERRCGDDTRGRLLDAVEGLIADHGFKPLTHRTIASRAEAHVALLNYHFGSKEQLIEDVLWAYGRPFATLDDGEASAWRNYLCLVARLAGHDPSDSIMLRHFGSVYRECLSALRHALPGVDDAALASGFRNCRLLLEHDARARCKAGAAAPAPIPTGEQLIAFLAGGLRSLTAQEKDAQLKSEATTH